MVHNEKIGYQATTNDFLGLASNHQSIRTNNFMGVPMLTILILMCINYGELCVH